MAPISLTLKSKRASNIGGDRRGRYVEECEGSPILLQLNNLNLVEYLTDAGA